MSAANKRYLLAIILILAVLVVRGLWFYTGSYQSPEIVEIDGNQIAAAPVVYNPIADEPVEGGGRVVIDLSHNNNIDINDLAPLRDRLNARGVVVERLRGPLLPSVVHARSAVVAGGLVKSPG